MKATARSATATALRPGANSTGMPKAVQASTSTLTASPRQAATTRRSGNWRSALASTTSTSVTKHLLALQRLHQVRRR